MSRSVTTFVQMISAVADEPRSVTTTGRDSFVAPKEGWQYYLLPSGLLSVCVDTDVRDDGRYYFIPNILTLFPMTWFLLLAAVRDYDHSRNAG